VPCAYAIRRRLVRAGPTVRCDIAGRLRFENQVVIGKSAGAVAVEEKSGVGVAKAFGDARAALHMNHGLLTSSHHSIDDAAWWFIALEQCCKARSLRSRRRVSSRRW
jgi:ribulose-5-phosphate 4-epimerase/fuculose-1-phosphate aldolase